jgi:hypothetical protein
MRATFSNSRAVPRCCARAAGFAYIGAMGAYGSTRMRGARSPPTTSCIASFQSQNSIL